MSRENDTPHASKNPDAPVPIPGAWRPTLRAIVERLARHDYSIQEIPMVSVSELSATQIKEYVADYGERLVELPDDSWASSDAQWAGDHWDALVDLWTAESGRSDMVLSVRVFEEGDGFRFDVVSVYVP